METFEEEEALLLREVWLKPVGPDSGCVGRMFRFACVCASLSVDRLH